MIISTLLSKTKVQKIGKIPVVILPLEDWKKFEGIMEEYLMSHSQNYRRSVKRARQDIARGNLYELNFSTGKFRRASGI